MGVLEKWPVSRGGEVVVMIGDGYLPVDTMLEESNHRNYPCLTIFSDL